MDENNFKKVLEEQEEMLEKHGWVVHFVFESYEGELNGMANIHTHGLKENFDHYDLQIVLPVKPELAHSVLSGIAEAIKEGRTFKPEVLTKGVLRNFDVIFRVYEEAEREVLRLFLPDPNGKLPFEEDCEEIYKRQMEKIPE